MQFDAYMMVTQVSVLSLVATEVVREAQQRHKAAPTVCSKVTLHSPLSSNTVVNVFVCVFVHIAASAFK